MSKSGPTVEIGGNMAIASAPARTSALPGKSRRAMAYAANAASTIAIVVAISAIPIELMRGARSGLSSPPSNRLL